MARLVGETSAALDAATLQDLLTVLGAVALHEAMLNLALALVRLIGTFGHNVFLYSLIIGKILF